MGTQIDTGLNDNGSGKGITAHYKITYDSDLSTADGKDRGNGLMGACEADYTWMDNLFGNIGVPFTLPMSVQLQTGPYAGASWGPPIKVTPGNGQPLDLVRYLLVSEVTEMMMKQKGNGWGYSYGDGNEGSKGEALSRLLGYKFLADNGLSTAVLTSGGSTFYVSNSWLNSTRDDFVNNNPDDNHPDATTGCTTLFLYFLTHQLGFSVTELINAGAETLADVYTNLTGDAGNPFPFFKRLVDNAFPGTSTINSGANRDDPFPLGLLTFLVDKSTFGMDEVTDLIATNGGLVSNAFWVVVEGFSIDSFGAQGVTVPIPTGTFADLPGVSIEATPGGPVFEDPTNTKAPQRIRVSFDIRFSNTNAFPAVGGSPVFGVLQATATAGGQPIAGAVATTGFELLGGEDPYFDNIDPAGVGTQFYLSQDLRVFSVIAGQAPIAGATAFSADPYASIQGFIRYLNTTAAFTQPSGTDPLNGLPGQTGYETADSSVSPVDGSGNKRYNFAVARVRLRGSALGSAPNVRVFFRLFVAQSCDTDFQPNTTYKSTLGTSGSSNNHPVFPLASGSGLTDPSGNALQTRPFFATDASGTNDYDGTNDGGNIRDIQIPDHQDTVWAYFGCFLDVYDASNNATFGGTHHCLVAEIAYDEAPIPAATPSGTVPSPANWDKLAQRNLQITLSENPKARATHVIPQAFDVRPSRTLSPVPGTPVDGPDELMIDWGNTPPGSTATIYWPGMAAAEVVALAEMLYASHLLRAVDDHTLACSTTKGVSYVPVPVGNGHNLAGLLTIDLPDTVRELQEFNIVVRRLVSRSLRETKEPEGPTPVKLLAETKTAKKRGRTRAAKRVNGTSVRPLLEAEQMEVTLKGSRPAWRQVAGAFQVRIPVTNKAVMLAPEEHTLAVLRWRLQNMPTINRWYPVLKRYVELVAARVDGLGGNSDMVKPSLDGFRPTSACPVPGGLVCDGIEGKVVAIMHDRFGDFVGFKLETEAGKVHSFRAWEPAMSRLLHRAWEERWFIRVLVDNGKNVPVGILLLRAPSR